MKFEKSEVLVEIEKYESKEYGVRVYIREWDGFPGYAVTIVRDHIEDVREYHGHVAADYNEVVKNIRPWIPLHLAVKYSEIKDNPNWVEEMVRDPSRYYKTTIGALLPEFQDVPRHLKNEDGPVE